jgi:hypothetical protein
VKHVEELGHANEESNSVTVKGIDDPLRRNGREENNSCADTQLAEAVRNERENV